MLPKKFQSLIVGHDPIELPIGIAKPLLLARIGGKDNGKPDPEPQETLYGFPRVEETITNKIKSQEAYVFAEIIKPTKHAVRTWICRFHDIKTQQDDQHDRNRVFPELPLDFLFGKMLRQHSQQSEIGKDLYRNSKWKSNTKHPFRRENQGGQDEANVKSEVRSERTCTDHHQP